MGVEELEAYIKAMEELRNNVDSRAKTARRVCKHNQSIMVKRRKQIASLQSLMLHKLMS